MAQSRTMYVMGPAILIAFSLTYLIWFVFARGDGFRLGRFVSTPGNVVATDVTSYHRIRSRDRFVPHVRYTYSVAGRAYSDDRIWVAPGSMTSETQARAFIVVLTKSPGLTVWYDPLHPDHAVLSKDFDPRSFLPELITAGLIFLISVVTIAIALSIPRDPTGGPDC